jgi:signal transduction histidine kinase
VRVEVSGASGVWLTRVDASQLENALLNLCINARDAMAPAGGLQGNRFIHRWPHYRR